MCQDSLEHQDQLVSRAHLDSVVSMAAREIWETRETWVALVPLELTEPLVFLDVTETTVCLG